MSCAVEDTKKTLQEAIGMREKVTVADELAIVYKVEDDCEAMMELDNLTGAKIG